MHIEKHGLSPSVIRCEQNIIGTLAENGANYPLVTVQAPSIDFIGIGAEVKEAYLQEINKHGTKSLIVKPKELIWANATAIAQIKKAIREARVNVDNS